MRREVTLRYHWQGPVCVVTVEVRGLVMAGFRCATLGEMARAEECAERMARRIVGSVVAVTEPRAGVVVRV
jgi:hypothetical protein